MATPEENLEKSLARAEMYRSKGDTARAATWEASADRYRQIIDTKARMAESKARVMEIKERIANIQNPPATATVTSSRNVGRYWETTSRPDSSCPSGHRRVTIEYFNGQPVGEEDLGCMPSPTAEPPTSIISASPTSVSVSAVPPTPEIKPVVVAPPPPPVKTAPLDTIIYKEEDQPVKIMADLIFENIGGQELINIARTDTVNGQSVIYQPIKNLTQIQQQYNPNNIVSLQATSDKYFQNFSIKLDNKVPEEGNGPSGAHVYIDPLTGDLVVEAINLEADEQIELEITTSGTIYEAEL